MEGAEAAGDPLATLPVLFHLMWRRQLAADLSLVLSHRTVVRRAGAWLSARGSCGSATGSCSPAPSTPWSRCRAAWCGCVADSGETAVVAMAYLAGAPDFAVVGAGPRGARLSPAGLLEALPEEVARRRPRVGAAPGRGGDRACPRMRSRARRRGRSSTRWPAR